ncbi:chromatin remodeling protein EBS-like isoform X2 [Vigna umbellata]|uniref:chromatin remodeling protein EBS-like isoform X2 n=1 Tax=Vigna umbellata TaxID=87088 RepID=UPI001F5E4AB3|nr:chromatin remodeling protein EBS-like isoform X2 [Vigna umbellata]
MPYNPDDLMVQCEGCKDWYHPACVGMTIEEAKKLDHFVCSECSSDDDMKKPQATFYARQEPMARWSPSGERDDHNAVETLFGGVSDSC